MARPAIVSVRLSSQAETEAKAPSVIEHSQTSVVLVRRRPTKRELLGLTIVILFMLGLIALGFLGPLQPN